MDPDVARKTWRTLELYHGAIYFAREAPEAYADVGIDDRMTGYFTSRSAPMGAVGAETVIATFFNFDHDLVRRSMTGVWDRVTPQEMIDVRLRAADRVIRRLVDTSVDSGEMRTAAELARVAAERACEQPEGRPLFAGHVSVGWPDDAHLVLWHAQTLLREYRGDGHIAALASTGLSGCEALVLHGASGEVPAAILKASRQRTDADWDDATESLRNRGWLAADGELTAAGRTARNDIEATTDRLAVRPYAALGEERCTELRRLVRPWSVEMSSVFNAN